MIIEQYLKERRYIKHAPRFNDKFDMMFQKKFETAKETLYFLNCRMWQSGGFDFQLCCDTDTNGYVWCVFREDTIELAEERARKIWQALGGCCYD